jgi:flagellar basal-body rod modification protein FlgD
MRGVLRFTQGDQMLQGSSLTGKQVTLSGSQLPLQDGSASLSYTMPVAGTAAITVTNSAGAVVDQASVQANAGANTWNWDGSMAGGGTAPDGGYNVTITTAGTNGQAQVPFTVNGTVTGAMLNSGTVDLEFGPLAVPFSQLQSVGNGS